VKKAIFLKAWPESRYLGAAEILVVIGRFVLNVTWTLRLEEVAPEPRAVELENLNKKEGVATLELLHHLTPDIQIIDGKLVGHDSSGKFSVIITAVDSTSWEIETDSIDIVEALASYYKEALVRAL
jgi:hypothetical protein